MTTDRFAALRAALEAGPPPGPWRVGPIGVRIKGPKNSYIADVHKPETAPYIAACDPDTIRELLEERDELAKQLGIGIETEHSARLRLAKVEAERDRLMVVLREFVGAAYPVSSEINRRGWNWSEAYLDQAKESASAVLTAMAKS